VAGHGASSGLRDGGGRRRRRERALRRPARRQIDEADAAGQARQDVREVLARIDAGETAEPMIVYAIAARSPPA
jgi:hypothetical protein